MIVWEEILVANGATILMMWFLLNCRRKNRENIHVEDKLYDGMARMNLMGAFFETLSFFVDGKVFSFSHAINYISNSICFLSTVSIAFIWCLYVDIRIYKNYNRTQKKLKILIIPWLIEVILIVCNLFGANFLFTISENNVYERGVASIVGYISLMIYFAYSIYLTIHSRKQGVNLDFFPIQYFIGPCLMGVLIQLFFYGITTSWISVAIALAFVQMQTYAENLYMDELSGLYNRRYLNYLLMKFDYEMKNSLYGIMMDMNDFKNINDNYGHSMGDQALCKMGDILFKSIPEEGIAIRYAGDEFIVILPGVDENCVLSTMKLIKDNLSSTSDFPFRLSVSMGYARFELNDNFESFLMKMDKNMYEDKRAYHLEK